MVSRRVQPCITKIMTFKAGLSLFFHHSVYHTWPLVTASSSRPLGDSIMNYGLWWWRGADMHRPRVEKVTFWRATRCGLAKNCLKTPKTGSCGFWPYQMWLFTKIAKSGLFDCYFWRFWAIFGKTTSGSSPKQDILDLWPKHVWRGVFPLLGFCNIFGLKNCNLGIPHPCLCIKCNVYVQILTYLLMLGFSSFLFHVWMREGAFWKIVLKLHSIRGANFLLRKNIGKKWTQ